MISDRFAALPQGKERTKKEEVRKKLKELEKRFYSKIEEWLERRKVREEDLWVWPFSEYCLYKFNCMMIEQKLNNIGDKLNRAFYRLDFDVEESHRRAREIEEKLSKLDKIIDKVLA